MKTLTSFLILCLGALLFAPPGWAAASNVPDTKAVAHTLSALSVPFIENSGQIDKEVAFYAKTLGATLFVTKKGEMVYGFPDCTLIERIDALTPDPKGLASSRTKVSSFVGNDPSRWRKTLATYKAVSLGEIAPGIDVALHAYGGKIEKIITVSPNTDPALTITLDGASSIDLADTGDLIVHTGKGDLVFSKPVAYQDIEGVRVSVPVAYLPTPAGLSDSDHALPASRAPHAYGFAFGPYDRTYPLFIDPVLQSTYLGGFSYDQTGAAALGAEGLYVSGITGSADFPGTAGGALKTPGYDQDVFVALLSPDLGELIQSTFLGGSGTDGGATLALGPDGIYVAGNTYSSDFPATAGGIQPYPEGCLDMFVSLLPFDLKSLTQSTYLGGSGWDAAGSLVLGPDGIYVVGCTYSSDFPGAAGGAQPFPGGGFPDGVISLLASELKLKLVEIVSVSTGESYALARADVGAKAYIDRDYTISGVTSGLSRGVLVQSANDDKWVTAEEHLVLRFFEDAMVYVCYDRRATILPTWLQAWRPSDESISTTDSPASPMKVYWKSVAAGEEITLGGNHAGGDTGARSNYLVVVQPFPVEVLNVSTGEPYALSSAEAGVRAYIDRDYAITQITSGLNGGALVQTANDDKWLTAENHLNLRFYKDALVYVCYDRRATMLPPWLQAWGPSDESISTTDSPASPMKVYWKSVAAGEEITLGGNHAGGDTGARSNYLVVVQPFPVEIMSVSTGRPYTLNAAGIGVKAYSDRGYTITGITAGLNGAVLVQTANDDKSVAAENHLTLRLLKDGVVNVCFDKRGVVLPVWLQSWTPTGESISTTDGPSSPMKVYRKSVAADEEITLGGNHAGGDTGAKSNYLVVVAKP
jgi:hypothetical protein